MPKTKLSRAQRKDLDQRTLAGEHAPSLAREFGVSLQYVHKRKKEVAVRIEEAKELMRIVKH